MSLVPREVYPHRPEADSFDVRGAVRRMLRVVVQRRALIMAACAVAIACVFLYVWIFPPVFTASVFVTIEGDRPEKQFYYMEWNLFRKGDVASEGELMLTTATVEKVVGDLGLTYDDVYHRPLDHVRYLWQTSWPGRAWRAFKEFFSPPPPDAPTAAEVDRARTIKGFRDGAHLEWVSGTDTAYVIVVGPTPEVWRYANALIDEHNAYRQRTFVAEAESAYETLSGQVARTREERDALMREIAGFERENGLVLGLDKDKTNLGMWADLKKEIEDLEVQEKGLAAQQRVVEELLAREADTVFKSETLTRNAQRETVLNTIVELQTRLVEARRRFTAAAPEVRELERLLADYEATVPDQPEMLASASTREVNSAQLALRDRRQQILVQLAGTRAELERKRAAFEPVARRLDEVPELMKTSAELTRRLELLDVRYSMLSEKLTTADVSRVAARTVLPSVQVVEYATPPNFPDWPNLKLLLALGLFFGLSGGIAVAFLVDVLDGRVTRERLGARHDLPLYATIRVGAPEAASRLALLEGPAAAAPPATAGDRDG
jgi:uncharacterized protein involved in exopolysaccharide biosynthesis